MNTINERISFIVNDLFKGNISAFCREIGVKQPTMNTILGNRQSKPSYDVLNAIALSSLHISSDWLLTGRGEMITPISTPTNVYELLLEEKDKKIRELEIELLKYKQQSNAI